MSRKVIKRKNVVIAHDFDDGSGNTVSVFKLDLNLDFQPDTMNVKMINALGDQELQNRVNNVYVLHCHNINEYIGSFFDGSTSTPNLIFDVSNATFNTEWSFRSLDVDGNLDTDSLASLTIHLEFSKHED